MKLRVFALVAGLAFASAVGAQTTLNVITAGDQNMVDYVNNYLAPKFEAANPGVKVRAVGTGPGDAGSQKIYEKLSAQQKAGNNEWDVDVAVIHQLASATMVSEKLLMPYRNDVSVGKLVSRDTAKNALGANVDGYVLPMFHSQIVFAYNPDLVKNPPKSFQELNDWVKKNPKQFGYNGVKGGMSGVGFVTGWVSAYSGIGDKLEKGPYDPSAVPAIDKALRPILTRLAARYLTSTDEKGRALDRVARFHLRNGAIVEQLNWLADTSANGLRQSYAMMVNYRYKLADVDANHEAYAAGRVVASREVRALARS